MTYRPTVYQTVQLSPLTLCDWLVNEQRTVPYPGKLCSICWPGIELRLYKNSSRPGTLPLPTEFGLSEAMHVKVMVVALVQPHTILSLNLANREMSFFPNSSNFIINGGEFVNNEGTNKIEKGKHIFVRL